MFINIIHFPRIKDGKDPEFRRWFTWSNEEYARHKGFISRELLLPRAGGNYVAVIKHESYDTFMVMHSSPTQAEASRRVKPLLDGSPATDFYAVVLA